MFIKQYFVALPVFMILDLLWIGLVAKNFYSQQIGFLMKPNVSWVPAVLFYLLYIAGLVVFVIAPSLEKHSWIHALVFGALFGLISYATYDLTNLATLKDWPVLVAVVDLMWGMSVSAAVSFISYQIIMKMSI